MDNCDTRVREEGLGHACKQVPCAQQGDLAAAQGYNGHDLSVCSNISIVFAYVKARPAAGEGMLSIYVEALAG